MDSDTDYISKFYHRLIEKQREELLICYKCQENIQNAFSSYNYDRTQKKIGKCDPNFLSLNSFYFCHLNYSNNNKKILSQKENSGVVEIKFGCVIIYKKLSRSHVDALITVSQKEILPQIISTSQCITCSLLKIIKILIVVIQLNCFDTITQCNESKKMNKMFVHRRVFDVSLKVKYKQ